MGWYAELTARVVDMFPQHLRPFAAYFVRVIGILFVLAGAFITYDQGRKVFDSHYQMPSNIPTVYGVVIIGTCVALALAALWQRSVNPDNHADPSEMLADITSELKDSYSQKHWDVVLRFGRVMLRPLWIAGRYNSLVQLGIMVEDAAAHTKSTRDQAVALIDALGWARHKMGDTDQAMKNIQHGISIAESGKYYDLLYKAHRHLVGISADRGDFRQADSELRLVEKYAKLIADGVARQSALAGLDHAAGIVLEKSEHINEALSKFISAQGKYEQLEDWERHVKVFQDIAAANRKLGNKSAALDSYRQGLQSAMRIQRKDAIAANARGAAELYEANGEKQRAGELFITAADALDFLGQRGIAHDVRAHAYKLLESNHRA